MKPRMACTFHGCVRQAAAGLSLALLAAACAAGPWAGVSVSERDLLPPLPSRLAGSAWVLTDLAGQGVADYAEATLAFPESGTIEGNGSCNRFRGTVDITGERITVGPLATTRRQCAPRVMAQEIRFLEMLEDSDRVLTDGRNLYLFTPDRERPLRFAPRD